MDDPGTSSETAFISTGKSIEFTVTHYAQLHEMRREYNRFIFQAPTIVVAVAGSALALLADSKLLEAGLSLKTLRATSGLLFVLGMFVLVMGYWALRSRLLMRGVERTLKAIEAQSGYGNLVVYPYEISLGLRWWQKWPSTLFIVLYILVLGLLLLGAGVAGLLSHLRGS